jgi:predicted ABC-type ATPase
MPKPKLLIIAGPNGSGKTSVTGKLLSHEWRSGCEYINADDIARDVFGDWNSPEAVLEAARLTTTQRKDCLANGRSLIFETVFSSPEKIAFIAEAKRLDYFIRLFFIGTDDPSINAQRIVRRVMEGGHGVPIPKIISRYSKSITNCAIVAPFVDRLYVLDNSVDNADAQLLFRAVDGVLAKQYVPVNPWAEIIYQSVTPAA